ncbi:MAG TPA: UDP-N-acetylglucosamine 1-carboxyvinyltransferase [Vicinamibacterales bacterium]|nr:UDP-N-acetylglucosamine 1-carboxyvinyltransferase [Vicinamibacterales bacterium]
MARLRVEGGRRLTGRVAVEGNKNSALPLLAACLLTDRECVLTNVPRIRDVDVLVSLMRGVGAEVEGAGTSTLRVRCREILTDRPDPALVGRLRGSVLLLGPLLARNGSARLAPPGGDFPARRTITTHLQALAALGAVPLDGSGRSDEPGHALRAPRGLSGASLYLDEASVTGTETALLAAAGARGPTEIRHAAMEPHVVELCRFLRSLGVSIEGEGTPRIRVEPPERLRGAEHRLDGDYIEAGSWGVVAAITGGEIEVRGARGADIEVIAAPLRRMGLACRWEDDRFVVEPSRLTAVRRITTGLWPGFPSDMVSLVTVLATQADGRTLVHDWLYELRLFALEQLSAMRADLFLCDPHRMIVSGPTELRGRELDSRDLRSGMALIAASLAAQGESRIAPLETVERGYASLVDRLRALGAQVEREED